MLDTPFIIGFIIGLILSILLTRRKLKIYILLPKRSSLGWNFFTGITPYYTESIIGIAIGILGFVINFDWWINKHDNISR